MAYHQLQKLNDNIEALRIAVARDEAKSLDASEVTQENNLHKEAPVIQMLPKDNMALQQAMAKVNGTTMNGKEHLNQNQIQQPPYKKKQRVTF